MNHDDWRNQNQRPTGYEQRNYPSQGNGSSNTRLVLRVIIMLCSVLGLFASIGRYRDRKNRVSRYEMPQLMQGHEAEPAVPYMAFDDINELAEYSPTDTAFTKRSTRIARMHIPQIERQGDSALGKLFRHYSSIAQARTLYLQIHELSMDLVRLFGATETFDTASQKTVRRLTRLGKEYNYDVTKREGGSLLMNPLLQKINPDARSFNKRVIGLLDRCNETLAYLNGCVQKNEQPDAAKLRLLSNALDKARISADAFDIRDKRLRAFMNELGNELLQNGQIKNGSRQRMSF